METAKETAQPAEQAKETKSCDYSFSKDILHVRGVITFGGGLIKAADRVNKWTRATVVQHDGHEYHGAERNNDSVEIAGRVDPSLLPFEHLLVQTFHACVYAYKAINKHLAVSRDTGFSLLRYQPGQFFKEHIDAVIGHQQHGVRQLSSLAFLNDDFDGGEIEFPRQSIKLKPAPGDILLWPSGFTHPHIAHAVTRGTKFSCVTWYV